MSSPFDEPTSADLQDNTLRQSFPSPLSVQGGEYSLATLGVDQSLADLWAENASPSANLAWNPLIAASISQPPIDNTIPGTIPNFLSSWESGNDRGNGSLLLSSEAPMISPLTIPSHSPASSLPASSSGSSRLSSAVDKGTADFSQWHRTTSSQPSPREWATGLLIPPLTAPSLTRSINQVGTPPYSGVHSAPPSFIDSPQIEPGIPRLSGRKKSRRAGKSPDRGGIELQFQVELPRASSEPTTMGSQTVLYPSSSGLQPLRIPDGEFNIGPRHVASAMSRQFAAHQEGSALPLKRAYKKHSQACTLCRKRKIACRRENPSQPCEQCKTTGRKCVTVPSDGRRTHKGESSKHKAEASQ